MAVPKVATIHDLSGLGKCSLTSAIPILAAMGVQACPLPTAVLSNQTGYESYACVDLTSHMDDFMAEWQKRGVHFDGIYTGFLNDVRQAEQVSRFIETFRTTGTVVLVDPVLGDNGRIYKVFGKDMCDAVAKLVRRADIITPNLTEACILTGSDYAAAADGESLEPVWEMARRLSEYGPKTVVITGIHRGDYIYNLCYCAACHRRFFVKNRRFGSGYSGTGDILAAILCGGLVKGLSAEASLEKAAALFEKAIAETCADGTDPNDGIAFENALYLLTEREELP